MISIQALTQVMEKYSVYAGSCHNTVYVKDGAIIPMMPPLLHAPKAGEKVDIE